MIKVSKELAHLDTLPVSSLVEFQGNLKDLTDKNYGKLKRSLEKHGFFVPMFVWNDNGTPRLVDGHQRLHVCEREGWNINVPVVYIEAANRQEAKEKLLVISSQYGRINQEGYDEFTFDLPDVGELVHFDALAFEFGQDEDEEPEQGDAEPQIDRAAELQEKWQTERGQLWAIGEHRLLCGDSTVRADVERVMGGECAETVWTDPPYGMRLDTAMSARQTEKDGWVSHPKKYDKVIGDNDDFTPSLITSIFDNFSLCKEIFVFGADYFAELIPNRNDGSWIVWDKRAGVEDMEWSTSEFELCWSKKKHHRKIARITWSGILGTEQEHDHSEGRRHPTQKPTKLAVWFLEKWSTIGDVVCDPFAGSGTALIACQNLSRRGRAIEISPAYCAVILQRMADAFPGIDIYKMSD